jgi:hypothetical protein
LRAFEFGSIQNETLASGFVDVVGVGVGAGVGVDPVLSWPRLSEISPGFELGAVGPSPLHAPATSDVARRAAKA